MRPATQWHQSATLFTHSLQALVAFHSLTTSIFCLLLTHCKHSLPFTWLTTSTRCLSLTHYEHLLPFTHSLQALIAFHMIHYEHSVPFLSLTRYEHLLPFTHSLQALIAFHTTHYEHSVPFLSLTRYEHSLPWVRWFSEPALKAKHVERYLKLHRLKSQLSWKARLVGWGLGWGLVCTTPVQSVWSCCCCVVHQRSNGRGG